MATRRSARIPAKRVAGDADDLNLPLPTIPPPAKKAKTSVGGNTLQYLLTNSRSKVCRMDVKDIFNANIWSTLPDEAKARLLEFLPPTAFTDYRHDLPDFHPSITHAKESPDRMEVDEAGPSDSEVLRTLENLRPNFLGDSYLQAAAGQFQDQIFSSFFTQKSQDRLRKYDEALVAGTGHAPWKDEEWEENHPEEIEEDEVPPKGKGKGKANGGASPRTSTKAATPTLGNLVRAGRLRIGDLLVYKRTWNGKSNASARRVLQRHFIIVSLDQSMGSVTLLTPGGRGQFFDDSLLSFPVDILLTMPTTSLTQLFNAPKSLRKSPRKDDRATSEDFDDFPASPSAKRHLAPPPASDHITITVSTSCHALETHVLPLHDNLVSANEIYQAESNATRCFTVWRWNDQDGDFGGVEGVPLGGREHAGTVSYLHQSC